MELPVTPSKRLLRALSVDISRADALTDLVDNAWDQWVSSGRQGALRVGVVVEPKGDRIAVQDNAGGIPYEKLPLIVAPGGSDRTGEERAFGIYGVGAKRAMFLLGESSQVETRHRGEVGYRISMSSEWLRDDSGPNRWNVPYEEDSSIREGTTTITVRGLKSSWSEVEIEQARHKLRGTYAEILRQGSMVLTYNGTDLDPPDQIVWAASENAPPTRILAQIAVPGTGGRRVQVEIIVGVSVKPYPLSEIGFDVVCNGRLVVSNISDFRLGFEKGRLGAPHFTLNRFRSVIRMAGEQQDIPWNSAKTNLDLNHPLYHDLLSLAIMIAKPYTSFLRKNYAHRSRLFSVPAQEKDIRIIDLRRGGRLPDLVVGLERPEAPVYIRFPVSRYELDKVASFTGLQDRRPGEIGRYIFDYFLEEVVSRG